MKNHPTPCTINTHTPPTGDIQNQLTDARSRACANTKSHKPKLTHTHTGHTCRSQQVTEAQTQRETKQSTLIDVIGST